MMAMLYFFLFECDNQGFHWDYRLLIRLACTVIYSPFGYNWTMVIPVNGHSKSIHYTHNTRQPVNHSICEWMKMCICLMADSWLAPNQWETALLCNDVSHWLCASLESAMCTILFNIHLRLYFQCDGVFGYLLWTPLQSSRCMLWHAGKNSNSTPHVSYANKLFEPASSSEISNYIHIMSGT